MESTSSNIFLIGDTHSVQPVIRLCRDIPHGATVIHVGDFGAWDVPQFWRDIDDLNRVLEKRDLNLYVIRGNHDDPQLYSETRNIDRVHMLADYTEKVFDGKRFLFVGGGYSVDRVPRLKNGWVYSPNEPMIYRKTTPCDVLVTHTGPRRFLTELLTFPIDRYFAMDANLKDDLQREQDMVDDILRDCQPSVHVWGHFHVEKRDYENDTIFQCLDVNQIKTLAEIES